MNQGCSLIKYLFNNIYLWISLWISTGQLVQKETLFIAGKSYPESVLFQYSHFPCIYLFSSVLIYKGNTDLSTKNAMVNYYYYLYI